MKILDMHIHAWGTKPDPDSLISNMKKAGVYGGCVMSYRPKEADPVNGLDFDERVEEALAWCKGYEERLFPVVWIHPREENLCENVKKQWQKVYADLNSSATIFMCMKKIVWKFFARLPN